MRRLRSRSADDADMVDVLLAEDDGDDAVDIVLWQDASDAEFLALLHELALEAIALRAHSPGDPRPEVEADQAQEHPADDESASAWLVRRLGKRRLVRWAVIAAAALAVAVTPGVIENRRAAARLVALQADPEVLEPVASPPVELWRLPGLVVSNRTDLLLVVDARDGSVRRVDPATGETTGTTTAPSSPDEEMDPIVPEEYTLPGGAQVTWSWHSDGDSGQGTVTDEDGVRAFGLSGPPVVPALTDGSETGTLVVTTTAGDRLIGRDARTGRHEWSRTWEGPSPVRASAQVGGVMLVDDGAGVTAIDVRTGEQLWSAPVASDVTQGSALIDGTTVLLPVRTGAVELELVARRIADGAQLWRAGMPTGTVSLTVVAQHLVASTGDAVVGLG